MSRIYTEMCPYCGEEYVVKYDPDKDRFIKISGCKCERISDVIGEVLSAINDLKRELELHSKKFSKKHLTEFIDRIGAKLEQAL